MLVREERSVESGSLEDDPQTWNDARELENWAKIVRQGSGRLVEVS
jgi:hypothetical protein